MEKMGFRDIKGIIIINNEAQKKRAIAVYTVHISIFLQIIRWSGGGGEAL